MKNRWIIVIAMILALICVSGLAEVEVPIKIQLEGKTYEMPCELSHFLKNGWELYDYENYEIGDAVDLEQIVPTGDVSETLKTYMLVRKGKVAEIKLKNEHMAEWRLKGCVVSEIRVVESKNPPMLFTMPADRSFFRAGYYENGMSELEMKLTSIMKPKQKVQLNERESDEERKFFESSVILSADKPYDTKDATYHHAVYSMTLVVNNGEITQMGVRYSPYYAE